MEDRLVVDTSALLSWPLTELNGAIIVQSQVKELERHSPTRAEMVEAVGVIISEPTGDSISSAFGGGNGNWRHGGLIYH